MIFILCAYLFGALPHLNLLAKLRHIELSGDRHQDLWRRGGKVTGALGVLGEFIKGAAPVLLGKAIDGDTGVVAAAGLAAVCGQMWPVFSRFDGEKGNSIAVAMILALAPAAAGVSIIPALIALVFRMVPRLIARLKTGESKGIVGGAYSRSLPLGMFFCFLVFPFAAWGLGEAKEIVWCGAALFVLMIIVRRLTAGLRRDLKSGADVKQVIIQRLLYDRAAVEWRQE